MHSKITIKRKNKQDKESREKIFIQLGPIMTYYGGEFNISNPLSMSSLQRNIKGLQEISFNNLTKNKL